MRLTSGLTGWRGFIQPAPHQVLMRNTLPPLRSLKCLVSEAKTYFLAMRLRALRCVEFIHARGHAGRTLRGSVYFRCFATSLVISNMFTVDLPPNTPFNTASALIIRLSFGSCSLCFLI